MCKQKGRPKSDTICGYKQIFFTQFLYNEISLIVLL